jgi:mono/diheme cytochrome c family protein
MSLRSALALILVAGCTVKTSTSERQEPPREAASLRYDQTAYAATKSIPDSASNPFAGDPKAIEAGRQLFASMNCDGCHAGGEGWVAPSLNDGRWKYGGSDGAVFQSIYYGRPNGMPGWGELLAPQVIWQLVSYVRSLPQSKAVPTQSW